MTDLWRPPARMACLGLLLLLLWSGWREAPHLYGDGGEYYLMLTSLSSHGTPEARPEDIATTGTLLQSEGYQFTHPPSGYYPSASGAFYCYHFWFYSLLAVPLRWIGVGFRVFYFLNIGLVLLASALVLGARALPLTRRLQLLALSLVSPVLWYLKWPHPEVFTWACVLVALVLWESKRFSFAALAASLAALQNPPVLFLTLLIVLTALWERGNRTLRQLFPLVGALVLALVPMVFFYLIFRTPSKIAAVGGSNVEWITLGRLWSVFFDLSQGIFPYVPLLLLLAIGGFVQALRQRRALPLLLGGVLLIFAALASTTGNWNSGCSGLMRYGVWMLPLLAWLALESGDKTRLVTIALVIQLGIVVYNDASRSQYPGNIQTYVEHLRPARVILNRAPALYNPEPEIFVERTLRTEPPLPWSLPVAYHAGGRISKVLVDEASFPLLPKKYIVATDWWSKIQPTYQNRRGFFYLNPPPGAVKDRPK